MGVVDWELCVHEWVEAESQFSNESTTTVKCVKCGCPGEQYNENKEVFWPTT